MTDHSGAPGAPVPRDHRDRERLPHFSAGHFTIFGRGAENLHAIIMGCEIETPIGEDGLCFDYGRAKKAPMALCEQLDEKVLLPTQAPSTHRGRTPTCSRTTALAIPSAPGRAAPALAINVEALAGWFAEALSRPFLPQDAITASRAQAERNGPMGLSLPERIKACCHHCASAGLCRDCSAAARCWLGGAQSFPAAVPRPGVIQHRCDLAEESVTQMLPALEALAESAEQLVLIHNAGLPGSMPGRPTCRSPAGAGGQRCGPKPPKRGPDSQDEARLRGDLWAPPRKAAAEPQLRHCWGTPRSDSMRATCQDLAGRGFTRPAYARLHRYGDAPRYVGDEATAVAAFSAFGRLITPEEIAETVIGLRPTWSNGAVVHANLGQVER